MIELEVFGLTGSGDRDTFNNNLLMNLNVCGTNYSLDVCGFFTALVIWREVTQIITGSSDIL